MKEETTKAIKRWKGRLNTVLIEYLIFSALDNTQTYGGEIVKYSKRFLDNVKIPTVYSIIRRSIDLGLITKLPEKEKAEITRGTARQYYDLTSEGRSYLYEIQSYLQKVTSDTVIEKLEEGI